MLQLLSITDLFLVGLALDVTGAVLLAKGLLISPGMISVVSGTYWGSNKGEAEDRCRNRADAEFGVGFLAFGFVLQAVGYALDIGGVPSETGTGRLLAGLALAGFASGIAWAFYAVRHKPREEELIAAVEAETERRQGEEQDRKERERQEREAAAAK